MRLELYGKRARGNDRLFVAISCILAVPTACELSLRYEPILFFPIFLLFFCLSIRLYSTSFFMIYKEEGRNIYIYPYTLYEDCIFKKVYFHSWNRLPRGNLLSINWSFPLSLSSPLLLLVLFFLLLSFSFHLSQIFPSPASCIVTGEHYCRCRSSLLRPSFLFFFLYNVCFHRGSCLRPCLNVLLLAERIRAALRFPFLRQWWGWVI